MSRRAICLLRSVPLVSVLSRHFSTNLDGLRRLVPNQIDRYKGIHFDLFAPISKVGGNDLSDAQFEKLVKHEIEACKAESDIKSIWFRVSKHNARFLHTLIKLDFDFHHTKQDYIDLVKPLSERSNIPKYAFTNVGVGGLVVNDREEVLVVKEKNYIFSRDWKFAGGYAEQGEEIDDTAVREVFEETGVQTRFECLLLFRHVHRFAFDCSDLYFLCLLRPLTEEISNCEREIHECKWMAIEHVRPELVNLNRLAIDKYLEYREQPLAMKKEILQTNRKLMPQYSVYSNFTK